MKPEPDALSAIADGDDPVPLSEILSGILSLLLFIPRFLFLSAQLGGVVLLVCGYLACGTLVLHRQARSIEDEETTDV